jgi:hypothetical protein
MQHHHPRVVQQPVAEAAAINKRNARMSAPGRLNINRDAISAVHITRLAPDGSGKALPP